MFSLTVLLSPKQETYNHDDIWAAEIRTAKTGLEIFTSPQYNQRSSAVLIFVTHTT